MKAAIFGPLKRLGALAWRACSLRNFVLIPGGALLALSPLTSGPSDGDSVSLLPYIPSSAHNAHGFQLAQAGLQRNTAARNWLAAADRALLEPEPIELPFTGGGSFTGADAAARGYAFSVRSGQHARVDVAFGGAQPHALLVDLFRAAHGRLERIDGAWPAAPGTPRQERPLDIEAFEDGNFVLRVQTELGAAADYTVRITPSPLLAFPVEGHGPRAIWSGFGADRDGGRRAHRGVDIFAPRGTTALAAMDGWVMRVETTRVGGNVVWMQPLFGNMRLYYAHLDRQLVEPGQFVATGDPIGTVGNTGNAITTPPHLHFGVYVRQPGVRGGARDPAGFLR